MTREEAIELAFWHMPNGFYAHGVDERTRRAAATRILDALLAAGMTSKES